MLFDSFSAQEMLREREMIVGWSVRRAKMPQRSCPWHPVPHIVPTGRGCGAYL